MDTQDISNILIPTEKSPADFTSRSDQLSRSSKHNVKKCLWCGYEGKDERCPSCKDILEEKCPSCQQTKSECYCQKQTHKL